MTTRRPLRPNVAQALKRIKEDQSLLPIRDPPLREITSVQFGLLSPEEMTGISVCEVTKSKISPPLDETVYDERMGPVGYRAECSTCHEKIRICPGHFGHINLQTKILHPQFTRHIVSILKCVCLVCSKLLLQEEEIFLEVKAQRTHFLSSNDQLRAIEKLCATVPFCNSCRSPHPQISIVEGKIHKAYPKQIGKTLLDMDELELILKKVSNDDLQAMGFQISYRNLTKEGLLIKETVPTFRPEWAIWSKMLVMSPVSRPPAFEGDLKNDDDLTSSYTEIIKRNQKLADSNISEKHRQDVVTELELYIRTFIDNTDETVKHTSGKYLKSIKQRLGTKTGQLRGKLMGKRVDCSARTVITGDPGLYLDEVGIPPQVAQNLSFPETVTPRNIREMNTLLDSNKINMIKRGHKEFILFKQAGKKTRLRPGDIVYRHLRDEDVVVFNRQPTLHRGSMMSHRVRVLPGKTFRLNLSVTSAYNADPVLNL